MWKPPRPSGKHAPKQERQALGVLGNSTVRPLSEESTGGASTRAKRAQVGRASSLMLRRGVPFWNDRPEFLMPVVTINNSADLARGVLLEDKPRRAA